MSGPYRVRELKIEYRPHPAGVVADSRSLTDPRIAAAILRPMLVNQAQEVFMVLGLTAKYQIIAAHEVARGGLTSVVVEPGMVFRAALLMNAGSIIVAHNHPSGDPSPSPDDCALTTRLSEGGRILGIDLLDHVIIGDQRYMSFRETGRL